MSDELEFKKLKKEYDDIEKDANAFLKKLRDELIELLLRNSIVANIVESRVKEWKSIIRNIKEKGLVVDKIINIEDLIGIRLIFLFKLDIQKAGKIIEDKLFLIEKKVMSARLGIDQFGYQSDHYKVKLSKDYLRLDTWNIFRKFRAEIQVSTLAQHIWTAVSSKYDYHSERNPSEEISRSLALLSAKLEEVDRDIEGIDKDRQEYREQIHKDLKEKSVIRYTAQLDIDLLDFALQFWLPSKNRIEHEFFNDLLKELKSFNITTIKDLYDLIDEYKDAAFRKDSGFYRFYKDRSRDLLDELSKKQLDKGVWLSQVGLIKRMLTLKLEFNWRSKDLEHKHQEVKKSE